MEATSTPHTAEIEALGWAIAVDGIERHEHEVARLVASLDPHAADARFRAMVADRSLNALVRERAYGRLAVARATSESRGSLARADAA